MGVVFSHQTALALYRHPDALYYPGADPRLSRMRHDHYGKPNAKGIAVAHDLCVLLPDYRGPVHVVVSCQEFRYRAKNIAWHVARDTVPVAPLTAGPWQGVGSGRFLCIADARFAIPAGLECAVVTPEVLFVQLAEVGAAKAVLIGMELCGTYRLGLQLQNDVDPLTSVRRIERTLQLLNPKSLPVVAARRALAYILEGSASPRETQVALLLSLPCKVGGFGLPRPLMNYRLTIPSRFRGPFDRTSFVCDLFWPEHGIVIEYDSNTFHVGADRIARDATRRTILGLMGIEVVTVTNAQLHSESGLATVARTVAARMGRQLARTRYDWERRQRMLRRELGICL